MAHRVDLIPSEIIQHLARENRNFRVAAGGGVKLLQPAGVDPGVVVEKDHPPSARPSDAHVVPAGKTEVLLQKDQPDAVSVFGPDEFSGAIRRAVIDHEDFEIAIALFKNGIHTLLEEVFPVPVQEEDREEGCDRPWLQGWRVPPPSPFSALSFSSASSWAILLFIWLSLEIAIEK